jgi:copper(I)-binding protein
VASIASAARTRDDIGVEAGSNSPAHAMLSLNPFGPDIVLQDPRSLTVGASVPLVMTFRHAGRVTVYATVTPPGTP